ncbi:unnamed protein product [Brassica napus]|uniref:(rape) hypothetical protein n=1 Tax=Brassica napus TaxID=3708 RepID=A0A816MAH4_BRANA|nr:unnamed protein product [Brassica napus]
MHQTNGDLRARNRKASSAIHLFSRRSIVSNSHFSSLTISGTDLTSLTSSLKILLLSLLMEIFVCLVSLQSQPMIPVEMELNRPPLLTDFSKNCYPLPPQL